MNLSNSEGWLSKCEIYGKVSQKEKSPVGWNPMVMGQSVTACQE